MCGGPVVNVDGLTAHAGMAKGASVPLLFLIAAANDLDMLTGEIGNAFMSAKTSEKMHCQAGPKFGEREGQMIEIVKASHGLKSSARAFHKHLADTL